MLRGLDRETGAEVALKRVRVRDLRAVPVAALREMNALRRLEHPHIVPLLGVHTHGASLVLVMAYVPHSLGTVLAARDLPLPEAVAGVFARMLLEGLCAIHADGLLHRDIKPNNLLVAATGTLMIADFGQARLLPPRSEAASLSHAVATRWYRAPELLLGARRYDGGVDMWACGCVVAQMLSLSPLLPGDSDIDQIFQVVRLLGTPTEEAWPGLTALPDYAKIELPAGVPPTPLALRLPLASDDAVALVQALLRYDPRARATAREALAVSWIVHSPARTPPLAALLPGAPLAGERAGAATPREAGAPAAAAASVTAPTFPSVLCARPTPFAADEAGAASRTGVAHAVKLWQKMRAREAEEAPGERDYC